MDSTIELVSSIPYRSKSVCRNPIYYSLDHGHKCGCQGASLHPDCTMQCKSFSPNTCANGHIWCHNLKILSMDPSLYTSLSTSSLDSRQIDLDLSRTFPDNSYFNTKEGKNVLSRVLNRFTNYLPSVGYVQGMNYICAALLWHTSEDNAFWLLIKLMQDYKLIDNFSEGLPGLLMHCEYIENLIKKLWPKLFNHLEKYSIMAGMFMTDWCITLFTNVIPIENLWRFFNYFFECGWEYFYKISLEILDRLKKKILKLEDRLEILSLLKPFQLLADHQEKFLDSISKKGERKSWDKILNSAYKRKLVILN